MKRSINVIDLENRIQNNLNPSIKCKEETKEPTEEITPKTNIGFEHKHPSYDDENDWKREYFDDDSFGYDDDDSFGYDDDFGRTDDEEDNKEDKSSLNHFDKIRESLINVGKPDKIDDTIFNAKFNPKTLKTTLNTLKSMDKLNKSIGECNVPQDILDFIRKNPDFIPSCIYDKIKDGKLYLNNDTKDVMDTRKFCADRIHEDKKRKAENHKDIGYAFADINSLNKKVPYIKTENLTKKEYENVNHPQHYNNYSKEVIDMMVDVFGKENTALFCEMNAFKYRMRMGTKPGNDINQDLDKEQWYLNKAKELRN